MDERRYLEAERRLFDDAGVTPRTHHVALPSVGSTVRVLEVGDGEPVVFLQGGPNAAATWAYVAAAARGVRSLLVERPGTGLSERPPRAVDAATLPAYVEGFVADALDGLRLPHAALVGSSFGGYVALRAAAALRDRVSKVVLMGCPAFVPRWQPPSFFSLLRRPALRRIVLAAPVTAGAVRWSLRQFGETAALRDGRIAPAMLDWCRSWQRDTATMRNDVAMILACGNRDGFDPALDLRPGDLAGVSAPVLLLAGTEDPVGGEDVLRGLAALLPDATVDVWAGAGHLPWLGDPERAARAISSFVTTPSTVGPGE